MLNVSDRSRSVLVQFRDGGNGRRPVPAAFRDQQAEGSKTRGGDGERSRGARALSAAGRSPGGAEGSHRGGSAAEWRVDSRVLGIRRMLCAADQGKRRALGAEQS